MAHTKAPSSDLILAGLHPASSGLQGPCALINTRLPWEILSMIFFYLAEEERHCFPQPHFTNHFQESWMSVTHVCRAWREIASQTSSLWCTIRFSHTDLTRTMLARSKKAPLHVQIEERSSDCLPEYSMLAMDHLDRIKDLNVLLPASILLYTLSRYCKRPAPFLQELALHFIEDDDDESQEAAPSFQLPFLLFAAQAPCLQSITCSNIDIFPSLPFFTALTDLSMCYSMARPLSQILNALEPLRLLQTLRIMDNEPRRDDPTYLIDDLRSDYRISFPNLVSLILDGEDNFCLSFFAHTSIPYHTRIQLTSASEAGVPISPKENGINTAEERPLLGFSAFILGRIWCNGFLTSEISYPKNDDWSFSVELLTSSDQFAAFRSLCSRLDLRQVRTLILVSRRRLHMPRSVVYAILDHFPHIKEIRAYGSLTPFVLKWLSLNGSGSSLVTDLYLDCGDHHLPICGLRIRNVFAEMRESGTLSRFRRLEVVLEDRIPTVIVQNGVQIAELPA
ncbi:hypothetical protein EVG20_g650 [Dentipellis fragilis]|uniref:F-box domain-containing protein n=1 Tax=Dentipellis fragilis TaxID=205917 RepID=A0A4Y9ZCN3_9AGAM|nr:hypothetical protein EVG20_g650 [Dentipellis fragilis]